MGYKTFGHNECWVGTYCLLKDYEVDDSSMTILMIMTMTIVNHLNHPVIRMVMMVYDIRWVTGVKTRALGDVLHQV